MAAIIKLSEIKNLIKTMDVLALMKKGFVEYSNGNAVVPPVGELIFDDPKGDVHIKYGYLKKNAYYVIKIASGFYNNPSLGLPSSQGLMLLCSQKTGEPVAILLDNGYLTDLRTAAAGALCAKYFAPKTVTGIGILGTGIQARLQLEQLKKLGLTATVWVWGRNSENAQKFKDACHKDQEVRLAKTPAEVAAHCNLLVTTTPSKSPLLYAHHILPGTHITAVGSDTWEKQELDGNILAQADLVVADSISQSKSRGEIYRAVQAGCIKPGKIVELGKAIQDPKLQRANDRQISVTDLTGVAVQDIMIATGVYQGHLKKKEGRTTVSM